MSNSIELRPSYWASVSGGKDSLYMLGDTTHRKNKTAEEIGAKRTKGG